MLLFGVWNMTVSLNATIWYLKPLKHEFLLTLPFDIWNLQSMLASDTGEEKVSIYHLITIDKQSCT